MPRGIYKRTLEHNKNMSISKKGKSNGLNGRHYSEKTKEKMRQTKLGKNTEEHKLKNK